MESPVVGDIEFIGDHDSTVDGKPYALRYEPDREIRRRNYVTKTHQQPISDIRSDISAFTIAKNGFQLIELASELAYEDFDDDEKVRQIYLRQVAHCIKETLGASSVQVIEHLLRKRHEIFPISTGKIYDYDQPTIQAHIDFTTEGSDKIVGEIYQDLNKPFPSSRRKFVNLWKPLRGPVRDWPLTLCDRATVSPEDAESGFVVYDDSFVENALVRWNSQQKWYYISDQTADEAWMFIQSDSDGQIGVPHCAFHHPAHVADDDARQSIEVRAIAYFAHESE